MSEEYARSISKQVVAQLAEREGFQLAHGNALDALADVLNRFIREIGTYAKDYAEVQGRTDVNVLDLADGLHDLGFSPEVLLEQVKQEHSPDPFMHSVPEFPVRRLALQPPTFKSSGTAAPAHIPDHLPAFPAPHTIRFTQMPQVRRSELQKQTQQQQQQQKSDIQGDAGTDNKAKNTQDSLITLHQRLQASSGAVRPNPFLAYRHNAPGLSATDTDPAAQKKVNADTPGVWLPDAMKAFTSNVAASADDKPKGPGMRTKRLSVLSGDVDDVMDLRGSDDDAVEGSAVNTSQRHPRAGWTAEQVDETVLAAAPGEFMGWAPGVALSIGAAGAATRSTLQRRYSDSRIDAFGDEPRLRSDRGARSARGLGANADDAKKARAADILEKGADAILSQYEGGFVPRQGGQRGAREDQAGI